MDETLKKKIIQAVEYNKADLISARPHGKWGNCNQEYFEEKRISSVFKTLRMIGVILNIPEIEELLTIEEFDNPDEE